jgi:16S rRNA (guanine527-N7)-methyltransferase
MSLLREGASELHITLDEMQLTRFADYQRELIEWNQRVNLTSIVDPDEIQRRHFLDSLTCVLGAPELFSAPGTRLIDIGSGAGFPGLPLKIAYPTLQATLTEARGKRVTFLQHILEVLGICDVNVINERAEILGQAPEFRDKFDIVVARALAEIPVLVELCVPFLRLGGILIAPRRGDLSTEGAAALSAIQKLGGEVLEPRTVTLSGLDDGRGLFLVRKVSPTPEQYPRRPGIPAKRPLS